MSFPDFFDLRRYRQVAPGIAIDISDTALHFPEHSGRANLEFRVSTLFLGQMLGVNGGKTIMQGLLLYCRASRKLMEVKNKV